MLPTKCALNREIGEDMWQVLYTMETLECEVALTSAAIPAPMILELATNPVATLHVDALSGLAEASFLCISHQTTPAWLRGTIPTHFACRHSCRPLIVLYLVDHRSLLEAFQMGARCCTCAGSSPKHTPPRRHRHQRQQ